MTRLDGDTYLRGKLAEGGRQKVGRHRQGRWQLQKYCAQDAVVAKGLDPVKQSSNGLLRIA
jgi:hypothetical protein